MCMHAMQNDRIHAYIRVYVHARTFARDIQVSHGQTLLYMYIYIQMYLCIIQIHTLFVQIILVLVLVLVGWTSSTKKLPVLNYSQHHYTHIRSSNIPSISLLISDRPR